MTLTQLQLRTMDMIRKVKLQLRRDMNSEDMSDEEFIEEVLDPFDTDIWQDREVLKMNRQAKRKANQ